jgi:tetratricopeptide (TPR) repeat protein
MSEELLSQARAARQNNEYTEALALYDQTLTQTENDLGLKESRLAAYRERGELLRILGRLEDALTSFHQYYLEAGTSQHAVEALYLIGDQHMRLSQYQKALDSFREGLQLAEALNHTAGRARILQGFGATLQYIGRFEEAVSYLKKSVALFIQLEDFLGQMYCWNWLGITYLREGSVDKAIAAFQDCLAHARQVGKRETAITLNNLGECYQKLFDMEQALAAHQDGLNLAEEIKLQASEADISRNLGVDLWHLGYIAEALPYLRRALNISRETNNRDVQLQALYSLALVEIQAGQLEQSYQYIQEMKGLAEETGTRTFQADALHALGLYHQANGDNIAAQQTWQEAIFLAHETSRRMLLWQLHAGLAEISGGTPLAAVHYRIAAEVIHQIAYPIHDEQLCEKFLAARPIQAILKMQEKAD